MTLRRGHLPPFHEFTRADMKYLGRVLLDLGWDAVRDEDGLALYPAPGITGEGIIGFELNGAYFNDPFRPTLVHPCNGHLLVQSA